ncbi:hypothetical protein GGI23_007543, partial [Coemansia sp. RSA 2559]
RIVEVLADKGAKIVVGDILEQGEEIVAELNKQRDNKVAVFHLCDVSKLDELNGLVDRAMGEFGALDIVVNNAGIRG